MQKKETISYCNDKELTKKKRKKAIPTVNPITKLDYINKHEFNLKNRIFSTINVSQAKYAKEIELSR